MAAATALVVNAAARQGEERGTLNLRQVPVAGRTTDDFVPSGWKIADDVSGDLDGDQFGQP